MPRRFIITDFDGTMLALEFDVKEGSGAVFRTTPDGWIACESVFRTVFERIGTGNDCVGTEKNAAWIDGEIQFENVWDSQHFREVFVSIFQEAGFTVRSPRRFLKGLMD